MSIPHDYEAWSNVPSLPKLDLRNPELRRRLIDGPESIAARWLRPPFDLDGWRVDVANMAGRLGDIDVNRDAAVTMRATLAEIKPTPTSSGSTRSTPAGTSTATAGTAS